MTQSTSQRALILNWNDVAGDASYKIERSADGAEQWLNWVIRLPTSELIGYVQATVHPNGCAAIAYELSSAHWGRGLARQAVEAALAGIERYLTEHGIKDVADLVGTLET